MSSVDKFKICDQDLGDNEDLVIAVKTQKGVDKINVHAKHCGLSWTAKIKEKFHKDCRKNFVNINKLKTYQTLQGDVENSKATTRSSSSSTSSKFDYRTCCLFCTEQICRRTKNGVEILSKKKADADSVSFVESEKLFHERLKNELKGRADNWSFEVRGRVESVYDQKKLCSIGDAVDYST